MSRLEDQSVHKRRFEWCSVRRDMVFAAVISVVPAVSASGWVAWSPHMYVPEQCGPAAGVPSTTMPTRGACASGVFAPSRTGIGGLWQWMCLGQGAPANCSAPRRSR